ncbi:uncharacterized protein LOC115773093 [Archocentrus centrarchus]|uniref:uncharacterized protein LOC115773093 n=1 Tax=Archocentrus centrarchus TaxID=63155 RepID=UPI0011EA39B9|nr:uncharacterized protein LOC115773093 [Archocentrus centrarchus]
MRKMSIFKGRKGRSESKKPLIEKNNNTQDGNDHAGYMFENSLAQNTFNTAEECMQRQKIISILELVQCLGVSSESIYNPTEPNLELLNVTDWPLDQTFNMLQNLLQKISTASHCLLLMDWAQSKYMSREVSFNPDKMFCEWEEKATKKLLKSVQKEIRDSLDKILLNETRTEGWKEEDYIKLYLDTIQCVNAMPNEAQKISPRVHDQVKEVCFQEFLTFVKRYSAEQTEDLKKKAETDKSETINFLKTLKTCKELRKYVQTEGAGVTASLRQETLSTLMNLEASTLALLMKTVTDIAENHLKTYFKSDKGLNFMLNSVQKHFPNLPYVLDEQKMVMQGAYKIITHTYVKHLIKCSQRNLKKRWGPNVGERITEDANQLHNAISEMAPGGQECPQMLLRIQEAVDCKSIDSLKMILAHMQRDYRPQSEGLDLAALLTWKGLSKSQVREVLEALPGSESRPTSISCFSCCICS